MKRKILSALTICAMVYLTSCKGKDGAVGPEGPANSSTQNQSYTSKDGFIKGTATGTNLDGSTFSYNIDFEGIDGFGDNYYKYLSGTQTNISIFKSYSGEGDIFVNGDIGLNFDVPDMSSLSSPANIEFNLYTNKNLGNNKFQRISKSDYSTTTVSNLNYNSTTGILTGNYLVSIITSTYSGSLYISNGTFSTKLMNVVARLGVK
jgi:hypothetical protein